MDSFEKLKQTKELLDQGIITEEEYQKLKERLLNDIEKDHAKKDTQVNTATADVFAASNINNPSEAQPNPGTYTVQPAVISQEGASTGMKVLSFLIPLVGLILFIVNQNTKPVEAKDELKWAAIGFGVGILCYALLVGCTAASYY